MKGKYVRGLLISLICVLVLTMSVGVLAYMSDGDKVETKITIGGNRIKIIEDFTPPKELQAGISFTKDVKFLNDGPTDCFVRAIAHFDNSDMGQYCTVDWNTTDWVYNESDGYWYYPNSIKTGVSTPSLFTTITLANDIPEINIKDFDVIVYAESYQAVEGVTYTQAWEKYQMNKKDVIGPGVVVTNITGSSESDPTYVNSREPQLSAMVTDSSGVASVMANGVTMSLDGESGMYLGNVEVPETGVYPISVIAEDTVGNRTEVTRYTMYDGVAPVLDVDCAPEPAPGMIIDVVIPVEGDEYRLTGTVSDDLSGIKSLTVNGVAVSVGESGEWVYDLPITAEMGGVMKVTVKATDNAGNVSKVDLKFQKEGVIVDPTLPKPNPAQSEPTKPQDDLTIETNPAS